MVEANTLGSSSNGHSFSPMAYNLPEGFKPLVGSVQAALAPFLTEARIDRMNEIVSQRSRRLLCVFEDTHHCHNISAVLRTSDAMGFQDVFFLFTGEHIGSRLRDNVERGTATWLCPRKAPSLAASAQALKAAGYKIALVSLPTFFVTAKFYRNDLPSFAASEFASDRFGNFLGGGKIAFVFGSEAEGISPEWTEFADCYVHVEMHGFVESLNLSVCAGILLSAFRTSLASTPGFLLTEEEKALVMEHWVAKTALRGSDIVRGQFPHLWEYYNFVRSGSFFHPF